MEILHRHRILQKHDVLRPHEDALGYALRRCEMNAMPGLFLLMKEVGMDESTPSLNKIAGAAPAMAQILEVDEQRFRDALLVPENDRGNCEFIGFGGQRLRAMSVAYPRVRICPLCIDEHGYIPSTWQINAFTDCPRHHVELISTCPMCDGRRLTWARRGVAVCSAGHDLRRAKVRRSNEHVVAFAADIERRALGKTPSLFPGSMAVSGLQAFINLLFYVGSLILRRALDAPVSRRLEMHDVRDLLIAAGPVLCESDGAGLRKVLDATFVPPKNQRVKLTQTFPRWHKGLHRYDFMAPLRPWYDRYLIERRPDILLQLSGWDQVFRRCQHALPSMPLWLVSEQLRVPVKKLLEIAQALEARVVDTGSQRRLTAPDVKRIEQALAADRARWIYGVAVPNRVKVQRTRAHTETVMLRGDTFEELLRRHPFPSPNLAPDLPDDVVISGRVIAKRLSASNEAVYALCKALLSRFEHRAPISGTPQMRMRTYRAFERALCAATSNEQVQPRSSPVGVLAAVKASLRRYGIDLAKLLEAILDGQIPCRLAPSRKGLERLVVDRHDIERYAAQLRAERFGDLMTPREAMQRLDTEDRAVLTHLEREGFIHPVRLVNGIRGALAYRGSEFDQFLQKFISLTEIRRRNLFPELSRQPVHLVRELSRLGLTPVTGPTAADRGPMTFYRRAQVEVLLSERPLADKTLSAA